MWHAWQGNAFRAFVENFERRTLEIFIDVDGRKY
jgi:hypothetical protein